MNMIGPAYSRKAASDVSSTIPSDLAMTKDSPPEKNHSFDIFGVILPITSAGTDPVPDMDKSRAGLAWNTEKPPKDAYFTGKAVIFRDIPKTISQA